VGPCQGHFCCRPSSGEEHKAEVSDSRLNQILFNYKQEMEQWLSKPTPSNSLL